MKRVVAWSVAAAMLGYAGVGATQGARNAISASDKATGAKAHPQLLQEFGGVYSGPQANYVSSVGKRIAVQSGLSNSQSDFTVTLLNSPVNNAFAIPGGYVYITRELMALANDEAELASVLGHEVGHVAARHSNKRQSTSTLTQLLSLGLGVLTGNSQLAQIAGQAGQLYTLRFSRQQEYAADDLGVTYLAGAGYDPLASSRMLAALNAQGALDARIKGQDARATPSWASTHPNGVDRVNRARTQAGKTGIAVGNGARNRDAFLNALDGTLYEDDPAQGIVAGRSFRHPTLRLTFTVPQGFVIANGNDAVSVSGTGGQAQFAGGRIGQSLESYVDSVFSRLSSGQGIDYGDVRRTTVNGMNAGYASGRASLQSGTTDVTVFAYQFDANTAYHFVIITPAGSGIGPFQPMIRSFARLGAADAAQIRPRRVDVVTVRAGDTVAKLAQRMAYESFQTERFLTLNAISAGATLRPGQRVKLVIFG